MSKSVRGENVRELRRIADELEVKIKIAGQELGPTVPGQFSTEAEHDTPSQSLQSKPPTPHE